MSEVEREATRLIASLKLVIWNVRDDLAALSIRWEEHRRSGESLTPHDLALLDDAKALKLSEASIAARFPTSRTLQTIEDGLLDQELGALIILHSMGWSYRKMAAIEGVSASPATIQRRITSLEPHHLPPLSVQAMEELLAKKIKKKVPDADILMMAIWRYLAQTEPLGDLEAAAMAMVKLVRQAQQGTDPSSIFPHLWTGADRLVLIGLPPLMLRHASSRSSAMRRRKRRRRGGSQDASLLYFDKSSALHPLDK